MKLLSQKGRIASPFLVTALALVAACSSATSPAPADTPEDTPGETFTIPVLGEAATLDVATWNLEWFGDPGNGPNNEARQQGNVLAVMEGLELDFWAVEEVVSPEAFEILVAGLEGWGGVLANDPRVENGPEFYNDYGGTEQKVGVLYRTALLELLGARVVLTDYDYEFAGRPPLEVRFRMVGSGDELRVLVLHAKAGAEEADRIRREAGAVALKALIDDQYPDERVLVIGDFNDDLDRSIVSGAASPYSVFRMDEASYALPTLALSEAGSTSMVRYSDPIDHHILTDELAESYVPSSAQVIRVDEWVAGYGDSTSDHFPTLTRYSLP